LTAARRISHARLARLRPYLAIEECSSSARRLIVPTFSYRPHWHPIPAIAAGALLDPVSNTLYLPFSRRSTFSLADRLLAAMNSTGVGRSYLGYFDNMLGADSSLAARKLTLFAGIRCRLSARTRAVCGFVGRDPDLKWPANLEMFEALLPLLAEARLAAVVFRVDLPIPGWTIADKCQQLLAYAPGPWTL